VTSEDITARLIQLGKLLLEKTKVGDIEWRTTDQEGNFAFAGTAGGVLIRRHLDQAEDWIYTLILLNRGGVEVETLESDWRREGTNIAGQQVYRPEPQNEMLESLWHAARSSALNIDEVIDGLLREVENPRRDSANEDFDDKPPF